MGTAVYFKNSSLIHLFKKNILKMTRISKQDSKANMHPWVEFGPNPHYIQCEQCHKVVETVIDTHHASHNMLFGFLLFFLGCIPCGIYMCTCADETSELTHSCPDCGLKFGSHKEANHKSRPF